MLISSLPQIHCLSLLEEISSHPLVSALRYNTGMDSAFPPEETVRRIREVAAKNRKPLYIDLKGRQLRIVEWATLPYGTITLNHPIEVELPAKVYFRGDDACDLVEVVGGRNIYVDPLPKYSVGRGQAVNILAKRIKIGGSLTDSDRAYIKAAAVEGVSKFMLSFVEDLSYVRECESEIMSSRRGKRLPEGYELVLKIESAEGVEFVRKAGKRTLSGYRLMAARDDLFIQIGGLKMIQALKTIIARDPEAICASRLLLGIEQAGEVTMADISDLELMRFLGYRNFMFSDGISKQLFKEAILFWGEYISTLKK